MTADWPKPGRIPCCIPFCRRTASIERHPDAVEVICGKHWRFASRRGRGLYAVRRRRAEAGDESQWPKLERLWERLKSEITEASGGIR